MPTTYKWIGTTSTDPTVNTNYSPTGVPANGDTVHLIGTPTNPMAGGNLSAVTLALLHRHKSYPHALASSGTKLQVNADRVIWEEQGNVGAWLDGTFTEFFARAVGKSANALQLDGDVGLFAMLFGLGGTVTFAASMALAHVRAHVNVRDGKIVVGSSVTGFTSMIAQGGFHTLSTCPTMLLVDGGEVTIADDAPDELYVRGSGKVFGTGDDDFAVLEVDGPSGVFDGTQNENIGVNIATPRALQGGKIDISRGGMVMSNGYAALGGEVLLPFGSTVT